MHARKIRVFVCLLALSCTQESEDRPILIDKQLINVTPEQPKNSALVIDEAQITTRYLSQGARISVPITTLSASGKQGTLQVSVTTLDEETGPSGETRFTLVDGQQVVEIEVPELTPLGSQAEQAGHIIRYKATVDGVGGVAFGQRSLYHTLPKIGLRVWAPSSMDAGTSSVARLWVTDLLTGDVLSNLPVTVGDTLIETDSAGQAQIDIDVPGDASEFALALQVNYKGATVNYERAIKVVPAGAPQVFVSTDKPLYRPGQTIHIRALALAAKDLTPIQSSVVTFEVLDGKGNKIFKEDNVTDEFGVSSLTAPLATQVNLGDYTVRALVNGVQTERSVQVSEEKLPKFAVTVDFDGSYFKPDENITGVIQARYFFGQPVMDGQVLIHSTGNGRSGTFSGTTDAEGLMAFELPGGHSAAQLTVEVTDSAGFLVTASAGAKVAPEQLTVSLVPEGSNLPAVAPWRVFVKTAGPLGAPLAATCQLIGDSGEALHTFETLQDGIEMIESPTQKVRVNCISKEGLTGKKTRNLAVKKGAGLLIRASKAIYAPGESVELAVISNQSPEKVFIDRVHRGRIVESLIVPMTNGVGSVTLKPSEKETGMLVFTGYFFAGGEDDELITSERLIYVQKPYASVTVTVDKPSYLPGSEAKLSFQVKDESGKAQAAAIGVTIADEAVFALAGTVGPNDVKGFFMAGDTPEAVQPYALTQEPGSVQLSAQAALAGTQTKQPTQLWGVTQSQLQYDCKKQYSGALKAVVNELRQSLRDAEKSGVLTKSNALEKVQDLKLYDFWGKRLVLTSKIHNKWSIWLDITVTSYGPDELPDTWDDWQKSISVYMSKSGDPRGDAAAEWSAPAGQADGGSGGPLAGELDGGDSEIAGDPPPKKRTEFPETLYVNPSLITDGNGKAEVTLSVADVITQWRISMVTNTANGRVGGGQGAITVFQDFFVDVDLPKKLTQNDMLELPIGVFNFSDVTQKVTVYVTDAGWFDLQGPKQKVVEVPAGKSASVPFSVKVLNAGHHSLEVSAVTDSFTDGFIRTVKVVPDGQVHRTSLSGPLEGNVEHSVTFPASAIAGGNDAFLKIMGSPGSQMVDGIEALLKSPRGCFEPMMNSTWVDALVLDYLAWTGASNAELEAQAKTLLDDGVQQCVTFECKGGGFTWFGDPDPAHPILSSFALLMFEDIASVRDTDEGLKSRTQNYLLEQQDFTGSWFTTEGTKNQVLEWDRLRTTCIATWGLAAGQVSDSEALAKAVTYIRDSLDAEIDTYTMAMCANALLLAAPGDPDTDKFVAELLDRAQTKSDLVYWESAAPGITLAQGDVVTVETTALVVQALYQLENPPLIVEGALKFLAGKKSPDGNFVSTQGTIQALRAFVAAARFAAGTTDATVSVKVDGKTLFSTKIDDTNKEVVHLVSLSEASQKGDVPITLEYQGEGKLAYQVVGQHYVPWSPELRRVGPLMDISVSYDKTELTVGQAVNATVTVVSNGQGAGPGDMPMVDVGVPPGFDVDLTALDDKVATDSLVARYELKGDRIVIYLHDIPKEKGTKAFEVVIPMSPRFAMVVSTPSARAWPFYKPEQMSESLPVVLTVQ